LCGKLDPEKLSRSYKKRENFGKETTFGMSHQSSPCPLDTQSRDDGEPWPLDWGAVHVISIDSKRAQRFIQRAQTDRVVLCRGVNGRKLDRGRWVREGWVSSESLMSRGQIACFESHRSLWQMAVDKHMPYIFIAEDDTVVSAGLPNTIARLSRLTSLLTRVRPEWDALFLTRSHLKRQVKRKIAPGLYIPGEFWGLNAYVLSLAGCRYLLADPRCNRYTIPVDVVISRLARNGHLNAVACAPCVFQVQAGLGSATNSIE
jgi:glycosyl transferase family 25